MMHRLQKAGDVRPLFDVPGLIRSISSAVGDQSGSRVAETKNEPIISPAQSTAARPSKRKLFWGIFGSRVKCPVASEKPMERTAYGHIWNDKYSWMEQEDKSFWTHLQKEQQYFDQYMTENLMDLQQTIFNEIVDSSAKQVAGEQGSEQLGPYEYYTRVTDERPDDNYMRKNVSTGKQQSVLDVNALLEEYRQPIEVEKMKVSASQRFLAYSLTLENGSGSVIIKDIDSGEVIERMQRRAHGLEWLGGEKSFLYTVSKDNIRPSEVFKHVLGQSADEDELLFSNAESPDCFVSLTKAKDNQIVMISSNTKTSSEVYFVDANTADAQPKLVQERQEDLEYYIEHHDDRLLILTNVNGALNNCLVSAPLDKPGRENWKVLVPEREDVAIEDLDVFKECAVLWERRKGLPAFSVLLFDQGGERKDWTLETQVPEPFFDLVSDEKLEGCSLRSYALKSERGAVQLALGANADFDSHRVCLRVSSPVMIEQPLKLLLPRSGKQKAVDVELERRRAASQFPTFRPRTSLRCWEEHAVSADGTNVPVTIAARKSNAQPSGPCLFHIYGAYGISLDVGFNAANMALLERGWTLAFAHVRGGGELGRRWHHLGRQQGKLDAINDGMACLELLETGSLSASGKFGLAADSAGGVLGANLLQKCPQKFGAAVFRMPFLDVFTAMMDPGHALTQHEWDEWGNPNDTGGIALLQKLCPYQTLESTSQQKQSEHSDPQLFPPVLITSGAQDDRSPVWMHAKWVAQARQHVKSQPELLLNVEQGGHFLNAADEMRVESLETAFLLNALGS